MKDVKEMGQGKDEGVKGKGAKDEGCEGVGSGKDEGVKGEEGEG